MATAQACLRKVIVMMRKHIVRVVALVLLAGCAEEEDCGCEHESTTAAASGPVALWEPIDSAFAGCQGACGAHVEGPSDAVAQPGVSVGQRTYCPVSGAVFEVTAEHQHVDVEGQRLWFCCAGCLEYFHAHRDRVLRARGIELDATDRG